MAKSVTAKFALTLSAEESDPQDTTSPRASHSLNPVSQANMRSNTTPASEELWSEQRTLSSGTDTFDLRALTGPLGAVNMDTYRTVVIKIAALAANTSPIKITPGSVDPYPIFGSTTPADGTITLEPGDQCMFYSPTGRVAVDTSNRNIDITSADADAIYEVLIVAGT